VLTDARSSAPRPFHLMAKPTGAVCNLDGEYCFYLAKEPLYPGSDFRMPDDILEQYDDAVTAWYAKNRPEVSLAPAHPSGGAP
jgi:uncharacterized protein